MSNSAIYKTSAILVSLAIFTATSPILALDASSGGNTKTVLQKKIDTIKNNTENRIETIKEKVASREAALKTKLLKFKDQRKANLAEKISTNLNRINQNQTAQMQKNLATMTLILDKLEVRVNTPAASIASARATIASTSALAAVQLQKDYTLQITSEPKVKADAKLQRDKLHTDLQTLRKAVIDAKQSVANAIRIAKSGDAENSVLRKEGSASGQR